MTDSRARLPSALLFLRASVFLVMAAWTVDKFVRPDHAAKVFGAFYFLPGVGRGLMLSVAAAEATLLVVFALGIGKRWSYGLVTLLHGVSTLSSYRQYLNPFEGGNLLFFAAWPMLAACWTLYVLRDDDTLLAVDK
ncbi:hypothetical protein EPO15_11560 [bacterium]|nr:MAG: hypothetical protein EPO15_11560 [bacterium]